MRELKLVIDDSLTDNTKIYRYIDLSQFLSFIETKKTFLTKVSDWPDPWELPSNQIPIQRDGGKLEYPLHSHMDDMYGQCWTLEGYSDALWRIYSQQNEGIMLQTSVKKFKLMEKIKFGMVAPVIYFDDLLKTLNDIKEINWPQNFFIEGFLKRKAFEHEKEVRILTSNDKMCIGTRIKSCKRIEIDLNPIDFIEDVIIDPRASDWYVSTIKNYCKRAGFKFIPEKSDLYFPNVFEKTQLINKFTTKK